MLRKEVVSLFTAFAMLLSFAPMFAYAEGNGADEEIPPFVDEEFPPFTYAEIPDMCVIIPDTYAEGMNTDEEGSNTDNVEAAFKVNESDEDWTFTKSLQEAVNQVNPGGTIVVMKNIDLTESITITKPVRITSNSPATFTISHKIQDPSDESVGQLGQQKDYGMIFTVNGGDLCLDNIILDGGSLNKITVYHPLIYVNGALTLSDGAVIQNNTNNNDGYLCGGAVSLRGGKMYMFDGSTIANCKSYRGGGVEIKASSTSSLPTSTLFTMYGGTIKECTAFGDDVAGGTGGGVHVGVGQFDFFGGEIINNNVTEIDGFKGHDPAMGGGIYVGGEHGSAFPVAATRINGGSIIGNHSDNYGGGVCVNGSRGIAVVQNAVLDNEALLPIISDNTAKYGGGIAGYDGTIQIRGGKITGNEAEGDGGGIYGAPNSARVGTAENCEISISGEPIVTGNTSGNEEHHTHNLYLCGGYDSNNDDITTPIRIMGQLSDNACLYISRGTLPDNEQELSKLTVYPNSQLNTAGIDPSNLKKIYSDHPDYAFILRNKTDDKLYDGKIDVGEKEDGKDYHSQEYDSEIQVNNIYMIPVVEVTLDKDNLTLVNGGESVPLTATVTPDYAIIKDVEWKSSNEDVATVDENGVVTPVSNGTCEITATPVSPYKAIATCTVTVAHAVTFNANGVAWSDGATEKVVSAISPESAVGADMPVIPTRKFFKFEGWFTQQVGGEPFTKDTPVTDNVTVYAHWSDNTAKGLTVKFDNEKHKDNPRIYDIFVVPYHSAEEINRLSSAELKFELTMLDNGAIGYEITPDTGVNMIEKDGAYEFNFDGVTAPDDSSEEPGGGVKIGEVAFEGYGEFSFAAIRYDDAKANTAKLADNIVNTYIPDGDGETVGKLFLNDKTQEELKDVAIFTDKFDPDTENLTINIAYPNKIENQDADYQDMTLTISGGHLSDDIVIKLGENSELPEGTSVTFDPDNSAYKVVVDGKLWNSVLYSIKLEGAGYRTVYHTLLMTEGKTLNFWNNVKDNPIAIEEGKTTMTKNFLAGDIVDDKIINIYDLSAVVSYFGTDTDESKASVYAKYDLNRDGVIDSKDVAYVLVSWGE